MQSRKGNYSIYKEKCKLNNFILTVWALAMRPTENFSLNFSLGK
jgi:hypothetical protein